MLHSASLRVPLFVRRWLAPIASTLIVAFSCLLAPQDAQAQAYVQTDIHGPAGSGGFGTHVVPLPNGNFVVTDPLYDDGAVQDVGAVYLYDGATHQMISMLKGDTANDRVGSGSPQASGTVNAITVLPSGNFVVSSPHWHGDRGAATWASATGGVVGVVSPANSLVGAAPHDQVSNYYFGGVVVLVNGNFVIVSDGWSDGRGAVTWGSGVSGVSGVVSAANSLVGSAEGDGIGNSFLGVQPLSTGNYVVFSPGWDNGATVDAGAVTWGNGSGGTAGAVSAANSLVGTHTADRVGEWAEFLTNGNYVALSPNWNNTAGAVTWASGAGGPMGAVSAANSLVGVAGEEIGRGGVYPLPNGNYVVSSPFWNGGSGAATWGDGTTGVKGQISAANSLVGSTSADWVSGGYYDRGVTVLTNSNYVVASKYWDNGAVEDAGAVTWGNGAVGTIGTVGPANSLIGSTAGDQLGGNYYTGRPGVLVLPNGNYMVASMLWDNGAVEDAGVVTWGNGAGGTVGPLSPANSLVGSTAKDLVGFAATVLPNGNVVALSASWDNGAVKDAGAVTWVNGAGGTVGAVTPANSLVGSSTGDHVGFDLQYDLMIEVLSNSHYVVRSPFWDNGAIHDAGAVTWGNGAGGTVGPLSAANSLVGSTTEDQAGYDGQYGFGLTELPSGDYVVLSQYWDNGTVENAGAVTWGDGTGGTVGTISASNSLVGTHAEDQVGTWVTALKNGNYVVRNPHWDNGAIQDAGAVTWGNSTGGTVGPVSTANSLVGSKAHDADGDLFALDNGNYLAISYHWDNGAAVDAGAITLGNGADGTVGILSVSNSLVGGKDGDSVGLWFSEEDRVLRPFGAFALHTPRWDNGAAQDAGAIILGDGMTPLTGPLTSLNSVLGTTAGGGDLMTLAFNEKHADWIVGRPADNIVTVVQPAFNRMVLNLVAQLEE